ncbi:MAG: Mn transporter MntC [Cyanobacteriota bacterium]
MATEHRQRPHWNQGCRHGVGLGLMMTAVALGGCAIDPGNGPATTETEAADPRSAAADAEPAPQVVATSRVLCDLAQQVAEDTIALTCLLAPSQDPHTYQARPSDRQAVDSAALVLYDGYNYASSVQALVDASPNSAPKIAVLEVAVPSPLMGFAHSHDHDHGHDDHGHDDHGHDNHSHDDHSHDTPPTARDGEVVPDPHVWHNARHNAAIVMVVADALAQVNPDQASRYQAQANGLADQFLALDKWMQTQVATVPAQNRRLVTPHDAFRYFAEAYGFEVKGVLSGLNTDTQPSPRVLTALVDQIKAVTVPAIFAEATTNPAVIETVAKNAGVGVAERPLLVEGPGAADSLAPTTQTMLVVNTCTIVNALGGTCDEDTAPR